MDAINPCSKCGMLWGPDSETRLVMQWRKKLYCCESKISLLPNIAVTIYSYLYYCFLSFHPWDKRYISSLVFLLVILMFPLFVSQFIFPQPVFSQDINPAALSSILLNISQNHIVLFIT